MPEMTRESVTLEKLMVRKAIQTTKLAAKEQFGGFLENSIRMGYDNTDYGNMFGTWLAAEIMAEKTGEASEVIYFFYPKNWWQHFKEQCFPNWFLKWFPVKNKHVEKRVDFTAYVTYPRFPAFKPCWTEGNKAKFFFQVTDVGNYDA